ncbi:MAG: peptide chain release factor N(5)-glutamine methyltransferase [Chloroflexota bacterium]|nr:peptide chain release factor N(5)-glutamine methyltransferase [Chloroflexota bacterium]
MAKTISAALSWARDVLREAKVDSPHLDAELLLAHVLDWHRPQLYTHADQVLQLRERTRFAELIERRAKREPLAYLVGHRGFYGLDFFVDERVLIPRPETEVLVKRAIAEGSRLLELKNHLAIADIGTGCGAIAITLALHLSSAEVYAIDLSTSALEVAEHNCHRHGAEVQVHLLQGDLLASLSRQVDMIVANLPYVAQVEVSALPLEVSRYEPRRAWDGGVEGLEVIERLLAQAGDYLNDEGSIFLEIGATQGPAVQRMAAHYFPTSVVEVLPDGADRDRVVEATRRRCSVAGRLHRPVVAGR